MADTDVKFNTQAFLTSYLKEIITIGNQSNLFNYKNVETIDTSQISMSEIIALLTGKSESLSLTKLETYQYDSLIPKVRLFRVNEDNSEYEFIFPKDTQFNSINVLEDNFITGNNSGIKSINWILAGTNPVSAEKTVEVKIEFYFDSINSFSGGSFDKMLKFWNSSNPNLLQSPFDNKVSKTTTNYWSLIYHPKLKDTPDKYKSPLFRIKAIVGWEQIDPNIINEIFQNRKEISKDILNSDLVMYLNLVAHQFQFNEDGSIKLTANYIASLENSISSKPFDILFGLKEQLNALGNKTLFQLGGGTAQITATGGNNLAASLVGRAVQSDQVSEWANNLTVEESKRRLQFLKYLQTNKNNLTELNNAFICKGITFDLNFESSIIDTSVQSSIEQYNQLLDNFERIFDIESVRIKNEFYSKLIRKLSVPTQRQEDSKFFLLFIGNQDTKDWISWKNGILPSKPKIVEPGDFYYSSGGNNLESELLRVLSLESDLQQQAFDTSSEEALKNKQIAFTTIGHIVDAAFEIALENNPQDPDIYRNKIVFSNFSPEIDLLSDNKINLLSLASIPISADFLIKFLIENLYSKLFEEYSIFQLLKDLMAKVIEPALESRQIKNEDVNKYSNTSIASVLIPLGNTQTLTSTLGSRHPLSNFHIPSTTTINLAGKKKSDLERFYLSESNKTKNLVHYNYFIIYDKFLKDWSGTANKIEDEKRGIYHYTVGQDYGLVKAINFKRIDQPFLKESKSVGKKTVYLGQFRDLYNADLKMIGNNIYHPGMMLLIKPSLEFGNPIGSNVNPTFSQITGVGGYYSVIRVTSEITQDSYTTSLDCVFHSNTSQGLKSEQPTEGSACNDNATKVLQEAGFIAEDLSSVNVEFLDQLSSTLTEAQRQAQELAQLEAEEKARVEAAARVGSLGGGRAVK
jgi:hypothetical protein